MDYKEARQEGHQKQYETQDNQFALILHKTLMDKNDKRHQSNKDKT